MVSILKSLQYNFKLQNDNYNENQNFLINNENDEILNLIKNTTIITENEIKKNNLIEENINEIKFKSDVIVDSSFLSFKTQVHSIKIVKKKTKIRF